MKKGLFVVFEGGEGTGKSTQIKALQEWLEKAGHSVTLSWEPGGTPLGEKIRSLLLDPNLPPMDARCEALLYAAARAEHVSRVLKPALERGHVVLCDRYWDASRAYQGAGRHLGFQAIDRINHWATQELFPDRVYLFDFDVSQGLERARLRTQGFLDRLEQEPLSFHDDVRQAYLHIASQDPAVYRVMDAGQAKEKIFADLLQDLEACLKTRSSSKN